MGRYFTLFFESGYLPLRDIVRGKWFSPHFEYGQHIIALIFTGENRRLQKPTVVMNIQLHSPTSLTISDFDDDVFNILTDKPVLSFTALSMWVAALARCTFSVLAVYGERFDADPDSIEITLNWDFVEGPTRFKSIQMDIHWPSLPENRLKAVQRVAAKCTIHNTLYGCVQVDTSVQIGAG